jgi:repressor LexA
MTERSTKRQKELLDFVDIFIGEHGYGPSYREVMTALGYKSVSTVAIHINGLIEKGYLRKRDNSARSLEVVSALYGNGAGPAAATVGPKNTGKEKWLVDVVRLSR